MVQDAIPDKKPGRPARDAADAENERLRKENEKLPSWRYRGRPSTRPPHPAPAAGSVSSVARSMIGMNWMKPAPSSSRKNVYTARPWSP